MILPSRVYLYEAIAVAEPTDTSTRDSGILLLSEDIALIASLGLNSLKKLSILLRFTSASRWTSLTLIKGCCP